jgi:hypothetical protein
LSSICRAAAPPDGHRLGERSAVPHAQLLDAAQRGAGRPPDVVEAGLQAVELLDDDQRDDDVDLVEGGDARRIRDQDRGVEHDPGAESGDRLGLTPCRGRGRRQ